MRPITLEFLKSLPPDADLNQQWIGAIYHGTSGEYNEKYVMRFEDGYGWIFRVANSTAGHTGFSLTKKERLLNAIKYYTTCFSFESKEALDIWAKS